MGTNGGHCLCGEVTYSYEGEENWQGHCHCESCRRSTSSPFTTFFGVPNGSWKFTGKQPSIYHSSSSVRRMFCGRCGSQIAYQCDRYPEEIHFYTATLDRPETASPQFHVHVAEKLPWIELADNLPKYEHFSS